MAIEKNKIISQKGKETKDRRKAQTARAFEIKLNKKCQKEVGSKPTVEAEAPSVRAG